MMPQRSRVMQPADGSNDIAVLLQRLKRTGELVILARCSDLVIKRMDAVRKVNESAAPGRRSFLFRCPERDHAFQHGQGDACA